VSKSRLKLQEDLRHLEDGYPSQPAFIQQEDLESINGLRAQLGMPLVDDALIEIGAAEKRDQAAHPETTADTEAVKTPYPHQQEARAIYERYLARAAELERYQNYADRVVKATEGRGMTPVRPLATMGTDGGALLCDHCKKPIVLEGGKFHGKTADVAWKETPCPPVDWKSWILGGMVVELQTNSTLRVYHGYPRRSQACCNQAAKVDRKAAKALAKESWLANKSMVIRFVEQELLCEAPPQEQRELAWKILDMVFGYDPGLGINGP